MSTRMKFISQGFKDVLYSSGTKEVLQSTADEIRDRANMEVPEGFESRVQSGGYGGGRYIAFVRTATNEAALEESENMTLTKAVRA
ncbi:MAG: hypothetical protein IJJ01_03170 [Firmicutes bacterium]|nr:hypothetical protein [Bacillota bacterium]